MSLVLQNLQIPADSWYIPSKVFVTKVKKKPQKTLFIDPKGIFTSGISTDDVKWWVSNANPCKNLHKLTVIPIFRSIKYKYLLLLDLPLVSHDDGNNSSYTESLSSARVCAKCNNIRGRHYYNLPLTEKRN